MKLDINEIKAIIPHRYPFLLIDEVTDLNEEEGYIKAKKNYSYTEPYFQGHFPDKPVVPGVLIVESLAQTGCVLLLKKEENRGKIAYFAGIDNVRFKGMVVPGDTLELFVEFSKEGKLGVYFAKCKALKDGKVVVSGDIMCAVR